MARTGAAGLGLAVLSAATFGTAGPFGDSLLAAGWSPAGAATVRIGVAALVLSVPAARALRGRWALLRRGWAAAVGYGVGAVAVPQLFFFNAVEHLSVGVALLLEYCGTLLVVLWMWLLHGQRPTRLTTLGGVLAIGGLVLVLDLTGAQRVDVVGVLWALGAAVGLASYFVLSSSASKVAEESLPPIAMAGAGTAVAALGLVVVDVTRVLPFRMATADVRLAHTSLSWLVPVVGVALIATVTAYVTGIAAARRLGARVASFVGLAEVLFAIVFAWVLLGQRPSALQGVGALVVLAGIALVRVGDTSSAGSVRRVEPPAHARRVTVAPERLARWLAGFTERHGETATDVGSDVLALTGADGDRAWLHVPYPPLAEPTVDALVQHAARSRRIGVLLVRRGGYAVGVFDGRELRASKVGSRYVQGTTKAGGWSQQRYARRRANQAGAAFADAADTAVRVLNEQGALPSEGERRLDALVVGGDRDAVASVLADRRLSALPAPSGPWLEVKDPKLAVLRATPEQFRAVRISLVP